MTNDPACVFCRTVPFLVIWRDRGDREYALCGECWSRVVAGEVGRRDGIEAEAERAKAKDVL